MTGLTFEPAPATAGNRDGRQWLKDNAFCDSIIRALKETYDSEQYLRTTVVGDAELRKVRGALRHFADDEGWGISLKTDTISTTNDVTTYGVTFRAQVKREIPPTTGPRKIRRRQDETDADYLARVQAKFPREKNEKPSDYDARIASVSLPK